MVGVGGVVKDYSESPHLPRSPQRAGVGTGVLGHPGTPVGTSVECARFGRTPGEGRELVLLCRHGLGPVTRQRQVGPVAEVVRVRVRGPGGRGGLVACPGTGLEGVDGG